MVLCELCYGRSGGDAQDQDIAFYTAFPEGESFFQVGHTEVAQS